MYLAEEAIEYLKYFLEELVLFLIPIKKHLKVI